MGALRKIKNIAKDTFDYVNKVSKTVNETDYMRKGHEFEKHMAKDLFSEKYFDIVLWTHDQEHKHGGVKVESDREPDLKIRYKPTGEEFFVECKFRSRLSPEGKLEWADEYSLKKYQRYSAQLPVFIVVGVGGEPAKPERMFCIPLREAKWTGLYPSVYERFTHSPTSKFFWRNGILS